MNPGTLSTPGNKLRTIGINHGILSTQDNKHRNIGTILGIRSTGVRKPKTSFSSNIQSTGHLKPNSFSSVRR
jgi:hypothetical protein